MAYRKKRVRKQKPMVTLPSSKKLAKGHTFKSVDAYGIKPDPFPRCLLTKCRYAIAGAQLNQTISDISVGNTYRLNSIYDPLYAAGGQTCVGHAQLASIYGKYWVMGAKVTVSFNNPEFDGLRVGCRLRIEAGTTAIGTQLYLIAQRPNTYVQGLNDSGSQRKTFNYYVKPWTLMGCSKLEYLANSSLYSSYISANPSVADSCLLDVFAVDPTKNVNSVDYSIKIEYYTKLYSRHPLVQSTI